MAVNISRNISRFISGKKECLIQVVCRDCDFKIGGTTLLTLPDVGFFGIFNVGGGAIWPPYPILGNFWPFFEKMAIIQKQIYFNPFLQKNHPWHDFLVKNFPIPRKGRAKTPSGVQILVLKKFGSKISHRKVSYLKID